MRNDEIREMSEERAKILGNNIFNFNGLYVRGKWTFASYMQDSY